MTFFDWLGVRTTPLWRLMRTQAIAGRFLTMSLESEDTDGKAPARLAAGAPLRLLLAGGGHAHLGVLEAWIRRRPVGVETWMVTPDPSISYSGMIPGWMAGIYADGEQMIDLRPLANAAGVRLVLDTICGIDCGRRLAALAGGKVLSFDVLSLATGGEVDTSSLAVLGDRLLPVRPVQDFITTWPRVVEEAALRPGYCLVVVGGGAAGIELVLAATQALQRVTAHAEVVLVTDEAGLLSGHVPSVREKALAVLGANRIAVHVGHGAGVSDGILLADGTAIDADCVIAATGSKAPRWFRSSGLQLNAQGFIAVGADLRSISHPYVFAAGDIVSRVDRPVDRSGVHAVKAGPVLAVNLRAALLGGQMRSYIPNRRTLYLLATGDRRAILSWGPIVFSGRLMWRLKDWIDRRFINRFARLGRAGALPQ